MIDTVDVIEARTAVDLIRQCASKALENISKPNPCWGNYVSEIKFIEKISNDISERITRSLE